jgi:hypothetical protein
MNVEEAQKMLKRAKEIIKNSKIPTGVEKLSLPKEIEVISSPGGTVKKVSSKKSLPLAPKKEEAVVEEKPVKKKSPGVAELKKQLKEIRKDQVKPLSKMGKYELMKELEKYSS